MMKMNLQLFATLLLLSGGRQLALAKIVFEEMDEAQEAEQAQAEQAASSGKAVDYFQPAIKLMMWIQQNDGLVSQTQPCKTDADVHMRGGVLAASCCWRPA